MQYIIKIDLRSNMRKWDRNKNISINIWWFINGLLKFGWCYKVAFCHFQVLMPWLIMEWCLIMYFIMHNKYKLHTWWFTIILKIRIIYPWKWNTSSEWIEQFGKQSMSGINGPHINHLFYENVKVILPFQMLPEFFQQGLAAKFQYAKQRITQCVLPFP